MMNGTLMATRRVVIVITGVADGERASVGVAATGIAIRPVRRGILGMSVRMTRTIRSSYRRGSMSKGTGRRRATRWRMASPSSWVVRGSLSFSVDWAEEVGRRKRTLGGAGGVGIDVEGGLATRFLRRRRPTMMITRWDYEDRVTKDPMMRKPMNILDDYFELGQGEREGLRVATRVPLRDKLRPRGWTRLILLIPLTSLTTLLLRPHNPKQNQTHQPRLRTFPRYIRARVVVPSDLYNSNA